MWPTHRDSAAPPRRRRFIHSFIHFLTRMLWVRSVFSIGAWVRCKLLERSCSMPRILLGIVSPAEHHLGCCNCHSHVLWYSPAVTTTLSRNLFLQRDCQEAVVINYHYYKKTKTTTYTHIHEGDNPPHTGDSSSFTWTTLYRHGEKSLLV